MKEQGKQKAETATKAKLLLKPGQDPVRSLTYRVEAVWAGCSTALLSSPLACTPPTRTWRCSMAESSLSPMLGSKMREAANSRTFMLLPWGVRCIDVLKLAILLC